MAQAIPQGLHSVTPHLIVKGAAQAIEFYKRAFDATEVSRMPGPDGSVMHAAIKIGDSSVFLADEQPQGPTVSPSQAGVATSSVMLYVEDADATYKSAVKAGAEPLAPLQDMFWGDRWGMVKDPFGQVWQLATHIEDVSPGEMNRRMQAFGG